MNGLQGTTDTERSVRRSYQRPHAPPSSEAASFSISAVCRSRCQLLLEPEALVEPEPRLVPDVETLAEPGVRPHAVEITWPDQPLGAEDELLRTAARGRTDVLPEGDPDVREAIEEVQFVHVRRRPAPARSRSRESALLHSANMRK